MGRPKLTDETRRDRTIGVRVSRAEFDQVHKKAAAAGLSVGKLTRQLWSGHVVRPVVVPGRFSVRERQELRRIGVNINQAVRRLARSVHLFTGRHRGIRRIERLAHEIHETALRISEQVDPPEDGNTSS